MATALAGAGPRLWAPARHSSFRLLWLGQSLSLLGDRFSFIAFSWITLSLTHSTLALGYVLTLQAVPRALLTLVGGSLSDKWSTRTMMMTSSWARAALMAAVGAAGLTGTLVLWMLCAAAAAFGVVDALFQPARVSILPSVVDHDLLTPANALLGMGARVSAVLGPAVAGIVVALSQAPVAFLVDGVCFTLCGLCVARIRPVQHSGAAPSGAAPSEAAAETSASGESLAARIRVGVRYAWEDSRLRTVLAVDTAVNFCYAGPFTVGFAALARSALHGGSATFGLLNGALAGGAMLGTLAGGTVGGRPRVGLLLAALAGWLAIGMGLLGLFHNTPAAVGTVLIMGFGIGFEGVFGLSWIHGNIPQSVLSRVISVDLVLGYAAAPASLILCGALAQVSTAAMFAVVALVLMLTALSVLASRPVREMQ